MHTTAPGSIERHLEYIEDWLIQIARYTQETRDSMAGRGGTGAAAPQRDEESRLDRWAKKIEGAVATGINYRIGQFQNIANRGFSGTVEQARYEHSMDQLGKQFAGIMSPIFNGFTYAASEIERRFRGLTLNQQNGIMGAVLGAGIGARFGGVPGALLGFTAGSAFMGGGSTTGAMTGAGAGAWLGFRTAGPVGALFGAVGGAAASAPRSYADEKPSEYYTRMREAGASKVGAVFSTGAEAVSRLFGGSTTPGAPPAAGPPPAPRREVTPFSADPLAAGGTADLIQKALIRATAGADFEENNPMKPLIDIGIRAIEILIAIATSSGVAVPASAVEARS